MKIKTQAQDFIVNEILEVPALAQGVYGLYKLTKTGENTVECLYKIADQLHLPFSSFAFGGRKDRHSLSTQYITIQSSHHPLKIDNKRYQLEFMGFLDRPMGPDLIHGNAFSITLRDLHEEEGAALEAALRQVETSGFPNFFDDQRFGTYDPGQGFLAEKILKKHFNGALKIYMTRRQSDDDKKTKENKAFFTHHWGQWQECFDHSTTQLEKTTFGHLRTAPTAFTDILRKIPKEELTLFFSAYQSFLWNEILRKILKKTFKNALMTHAGLTGPYLFYRQMNASEAQSLDNLTIPTFASKMNLSNPLVKETVQETLDEQKLKTSMFNLTKIRQAYFKSFDRPAIVKPGQVSFEIMNDEIFKTKKKMTLSFTLPRGSFATLLIKRVCHTTS